ncbi:MAG: hypothetical protein A2261_02770 [Candidatus Magasanikbacteria bacterium RIFOXYA2_FULL_44_8]|uniref:Membrane insertase YidC/Oxa/ALB C-terminal domain-containing protein n=1 Tax=Candidatus Magasanikbacteria bacterium RIFOXYA2_FULL_44_8 TaxID=1798696 RepID=A0A1F6NKK4_9BACT|nr:MAG: hypothetical protein A2261_02770 [Candidatus Magasanikbacteria bacterium RIFOXYA2_FULL_44_8]
MEFLSLFWHSYLFQPLLNALIWLYANVAQNNMGWAVIWLTVALRVILLPLNIISERNEIEHESAEIEAEAAAKAFKNDHIAQNEAFRRIMKKHKISPWAKTAMLLIQIIVLVLLYQVFVRGMSGERLAKELYAFMDLPGRINNIFYGFDISLVHDRIWPGIVAVYLLISIYLENRDRLHWDRSQMFYLVMFPIFTYYALWYLPMIKCLFILTTMVFSDIITIIRKIIFPIKKAEKPA